VWVRDKRFDRIVNPARRMGGALAIPINSCRDDDGFRKELNPSYGLRAWRRLTTEAVPLA
jgi:hypothetical protein